MSKEDRKKLLRELELKAKIKDEVSKSRELHEDLSWQGIGFNTIKIIHNPSMSNGEVWDVNYLPGEYNFDTKENEKGTYTTYYSIIDCQSQKIIPGCYKVGIDSQLIVDFLEELKEVKLKSIFPLTGAIGCDGNINQLILSNGFSKLSLHWWGDHPEEWEEVTRLTMSFLNVLRNQKKEKILV